ncbi:MAG: molecular chaperone HtpG [Gammaproteobacteria bacterium]|nr:molecular chaperone HtpG [Gammaproteobacteria bacterium]MBI5615368.1 molecular chaperone HtpG [Gammaproteobacteria bacterium]
MTTDTASKETRGFQSEVNQLLDLVINSLYSHREIFLRELVSNASDAIDKLKFLALTNEGLYESDAESIVDIEFDTAAKTITVRDNGIGMTREEVVDHLGTIARSGTKEFFGKLSGDAKQDSQLIGQFGVGFYAAFIVADRVTVNSRRAGTAPDAGVRWESDGKGEFTVETIARPSRGTEVILHLKDDALEFANGWRLRDLVKRYSDHISTPIRMKKEGKDETGTETVNHATALWTRAKQEISDDDYKAFYKHVSHDFEDPMAWVHTKSEGKLEYTTLFYIPGRAPFDLFDRDSARGVKLYVQRVFIMEDAEQLLPRYLRFIRGIVDTRDLPLNVSRELLQRNKAIDTIRGASIKKILGMIEDLAGGENYGSFWQAFGRVLKEGVIEDGANRDRIAKLLRFASTKLDQAEHTVSLEDYKSRMVDGQTAIYFLTAENHLTAKNSPHLEIFREKGLEVLLLTDPVDEWLVSHLTEFDGTPLKSVLHGQLELPGASTEEGKDEQAEDEHAALVGRIKTALGEKVKDVRSSRRLTHSPACLVSEDFDMSANLARILKASGQEVPATTRILEVNAGHPLVTHLADEADEDRFKAWTSILFEQAVLAEGGRLEDPAGFVHRVNELVLDLAKAARPG